jgi:hypothetical protein
VVLHSANGLSVQRTMPADTHRQYRNSMLMGFMGSEFYEMWNIIIAMAFQCLSV